MSWCEILLFWGVFWSNVAIWAEFFSKSFLGRTSSCRTQVYMNLYKLFIFIWKIYQNVDIYINSNKLGWNFATISKYLDYTVNPILSIPCPVFDLPHSNFYNVMSTFGFYISHLVITQNRSFNWKFWGVDVKAQLTTTHVSSKPIRLFRWTRDWLEPTITLVK